LAQAACGGRPGKKGAAALRANGAERAPRSSVALPVTRHLPQPELWIFTSFVELLPPSQGGQARLSLEPWDGG